MFSDDLDVVEDFKRSVSFSIEVDKVGATFGQTINSLNLIRNRIRYLKRIYRELSDIGVKYISDADE